MGTDRSGNEKKGLAKDVLNVAWAALEWNQQGKRRRGAMQHGSIVPARWLAIVKGMIYRRSATKKVD